MIFSTCGGMYVRQFLDVIRADTEGRSVNQDVKDVGHRLNHYHVGIVAGVG